MILSRTSLAILVSISAALPLRPPAKCQSIDKQWEEAVAAVLGTQACRNKMRMRNVCT